MIKHFIEFCDHIFPIEDVQCVERYHNWTGDATNKTWKSCLMLNTKDRYFTFPEEKYEEIKNILLEFNNNNIDFYETNKKQNI